MDTGLADIFHLSEEMWTRKRLTKESTASGDAQPTQLSLLRASKDISQLNVTSLQTPIRKALDAVTKSDYEESTTNGNGYYDTFSHDEITRCVENSFERARVELERSFLNQQILERTRISPLFASNKSRLALPKVGENDPFSQRNKTLPDTNYLIKNEPLEYQQNVFAKHVSFKNYFAFFKL